MKWMLTSLRNSSRFSTRFVSPFMRPVLSYRLALVGLLAFCSLVARAEFTSTDSDNLYQVRQSAISTANSLDALNTRFNNGYKLTVQTIESNTRGSYTNSLDILRNIKNISNFISGGHSYSEEDNIRYYLRQMQSDLHDLALRPTPNFKDILAGNPWWSTNSSFYARNVWNNSSLSSGPSSAIPADSSNVKFSFPELMSFWSAQLSSERRVTGAKSFGIQTLSEGQKVFSDGSWSNLWGVGRMHSSAQIANVQFTWFDWIAEVEKMKLSRFDSLTNQLSFTSSSNWVLQSSVINSVNSFSNSFASSITSISNSLSSFDEPSPYAIISNDAATVTMSDDAEDVEDIARYEFAEQVQDTQDTMEDAVASTNSVDFAGTGTNPYEPLVAHSQIFFHDLQSGLPDFHETGNPVVTIFDGRSGTPMDSAGMVQVNFSEVLSDYSGTLGRIFSWLWTVVTSVMTVVLLMRLWASVGDAI